MESLGATYRPMVTRQQTAPDAPGQFTPMRTGEFSTGIVGDADSSAGVLSEARDSARFNAMVPHQFGNVRSTVKPSSVLQPLMPNQLGLGMSAGDAARRMYNGRYLGSIVGTSASSFEPAAMLKLSGEDTGIE